MRPLFTWFVLFAGAFFLNANVVFADIDDTTEFQAKLSSEASMTSLNAQFEKATDGFLEAARMKYSNGIHEAARRVSETFFNPAFNDFTIRLEKREAILNEMVARLIGRFKESQSFLSVEYIQIFQTELASVEAQKHIERKKLRRGWVSAWMHGVVLYAGIERLYYVAKWGIKKKSKPPSAAEIVRSSQIEKKSDVQLSRREACKRVLALVGAFAWGASKFGARNAVGGVGTAVPIYFGLIRNKEPYALSEEIVKKNLRPALNAHLKSISN